MANNPETEHLFEQVAEALPHVRAGGRVVFEAVLVEDSIAWVLRIDLPDGTHARHINKTTKQPRTYSLPMPLYQEVMLLQPENIEIELSNPTLAKVFKFQQDRRDKVIAGLKARDIKVSAFCKEHGTSMENLHSVLQGGRRNSELEKIIASTLEEPLERLFPASITSHLGLTE